ncbi:alpha/beta-hydrolase family protein [Isoptericola sp. b490]|uniref:alpha/beta-hydrolase family protein n=1 Tax=Actinotalea lenta TaxID=3064654 RepID=UPI002713AD40|nr:alpha/beta-hydrolase family protein [Isoptericola sp. b490]MDO8122137.1 alpha/beta-hydrolase family protein [Isoptericola sp. b490]
MIRPWWPRSLHWTGEPSNLSPSQRAGIVAAAASVPTSLVPLLRPRTATDQGLITGLSSALDYALTSGMHEAVLSTSRGVLRLVGRSTDVRTTARTTLLVDAIALATSLAARTWLERGSGAGTARALAAALARRTGSAAAFGLVAGGLDAVPNLEGQRHPLTRVLHTVPVAVAAGATLTVVGLELRRRRARAAGAALGHRTAPTAQSLGVAVLAATGAAAISAVEREIATGAERVIARATGTPGYGSGISHVVSIGVIGGALAAVGARVISSVERSVSAPDPALTEAPRSAQVSGGPGSVVDWAPLTREPRRHLAARTSAARIQEVMSEPAQEPLRLYVGLTSAPTPADRVDLAMAELERTGALDRSLLVLCSPTGTGYVNHAAAAAWEYLSRGDCATLTMQYSIRPSLMSLDRVDDGRRQNHALWMALAEALGSRPPQRRPKVVMFGESLGAHTGQDPFLHSGTRGMRALFIERALWLGTPYISEWAREALEAADGNVRPGEVVRIARAEQIDDLDAPARDAARYVLLAHDDDGVALFGLELLYRSPAWLGRDRPTAVPAQAGWSVPTTFLQTAIDTKNAMDVVPGKFTALGHDYRADIARAVRFAYDLPCTDAQLEAIEATLRREELERAAAWG